MKTPQLRTGARTQGFTLIELLVVISIIAILAGFALPVFSNAQKKGRISDTVNNAHQIALSVKMYAGDHDGNYPYLKNPDDSSTGVATSNEAFELLMPRYLNNKVIFANKSSAWCKTGTKVPASSTNEYKVLAGECDWSYVGGLSENADPRWPMLATAFAPGTQTYKKATSAKGGVWGATDAVLVTVDGSAKPASDLANAGQDGAYIKRPDISTPTNMFTKDTDWLAGDTVKILEPMGSGS